MLNSCYAISRFSWYSLSSWYQFRMFLLLLMIGMCPRMSQDANGMKIEAWNDLKPWFQISVFRQFSQVCILVFGAACSLISLGLWFWVCIEHARSKILHKISSIHGFTYLILWNLFESFPCAFWFKSDQFSSKLA